MDFLVLSPPVTAPSEPPSGAFMLAAGLAGRGFEVGFLDLSLEFFLQEFGDLNSAQKNALKYITESVEGYTPEHHRSASGHLHSALSKFSNRYPNWKLTLMDIVSPCRVHDSTELLKLSEKSGGPFDDLYNNVLLPIIDTHKPKQVLISLAYLSQLPAAVALEVFLINMGIVPTVGGSLPNSLQATGGGVSSLQRLFSKIVLGDGSTLLTDRKADERFLNRLSWPKILSQHAYFTSRLIIPLSLSSGCFWNRCLFCPDREMEYFSIPMQTVSDFAETIPQEIKNNNPVIHLLDSSLPPKQLRLFLEVSKHNNFKFYGFARPTKELLKNNLIENAAESGCLMLQLGAEGGSDFLLNRFNKGIHPTESKEVISRAASAGIRTYVYLLFGLPGETESDLEQTLQWTAELGDSIDFLNLSLFNLPKCSELSQKAQEFGIDLADYSHENQETEGIRLYRPFTYKGEDPKEKARKFLKVFKNDPNIRNAYLQTPRWFRAAHLALMKIPGRKL